MQIPLHRQSAVTLARLIAAGEASPETVTRSFIEAISERESTLQTFASFDADYALAEARALHLTSRRGALHGLPIAVKDNIDTAQLPTGYGSQVYDGHRPQIDAVAVSLLRDAGAFVLGKTVTTELANFTAGPTRNPRNPAHTPGGSSSGSAAAVAAHFAPVALGTQTAGSVIRPAAYCGVVGFKPSARMFPRAGIKTNSDTLDELGLFANSVEDIALVAAVLACRPTWREQAAQGVAASPPAFGWTMTAHGSAASSAMRQHLEACANLLTQRGARPVRITWPRVFDGLADAQRVVQSFETARALAAEYAYRRPLLSTGLIELLEQARQLPTETYTAALQLGRSCAAAIESLFGEAVVLLAPSSPGVAPLGLSSTGDPIFNRPWQLLGCPMINLPLPMTITESIIQSLNPVESTSDSKVDAKSVESALPLGVTLVARPQDDARLLAAAAWIEAALKTADQK